MKRGDYARLVALAAIWGSSFLFMRIAAPELGAVPTAWARLLLAGIVLTAFHALSGTHLEWRRHWKGYALIGAFNAAIPFVLFSFAALHIPASLSAILNSTAPLFGALIGAAAGEERLSVRRAAGLLTGFAGVIVISGVDLRSNAPLALWAIAACLVASACYGLAAVCMKRWSGSAVPTSIAAGSLLAAGILLTPALAADAPPATASMHALGSLLALALICSAFAYLLYYRLVRNIGATRTLSVTYLIPLFGVLWGMLFLGESLPPGALAGGVLVLAGTVLVTRS
jgi:drug/metabolite transporter (DMT)-like permease